MCLRSAMESVPLHTTLETTSLGSTNDINQLAAGKSVSLEELADFDSVEGRCSDLAQDIGHVSAFLAMALLWPIQALADTEPELNGFIAIRLDRSDLRHHVRATFNYGYRD